ncbi:MAG: hypothetical protein NT075_15105 [Chloroflexi bacterium]|nr:hypothetical protein [Chloroflexota bacterium]
MILKANGAFIGRGGLKPGESPTGITGELSWLLNTAYRINQPSVRVMPKLGMHQVREDDDEVAYEL